MILVGEIESKKKVFFSIFNVKYWRWQRHKHGKLDKYAGSTQAAIFWYSTWQLLEEYCSPRLDKYSYPTKRKILQYLFNIICTAISAVGGRNRVLATRTRFESLRWAKSNTSNWFSSKNYLKTAYWVDFECFIYLNVSLYDWDCK